MKPRWPILVLVPVFALRAQTATELFSKAPPDLDNALRERVTRFYQLHVDGKFRQVDELIAEDSKDAYFESQKVRYRSFEIGRISYSENFTRALVAMLVENPAMIVAGAPANLKLPQLSNWRLEDGRWYWYIEKPPPGMYRTIGGYVPIPKDAKPDSNGSPTSPPLMTSMPTSASILSQVRLDRADVQLRLGEAASGQIKLTNSMPGPVAVRVELEGSFPGLRAAFDKTEVASQQSATLTILYEPTDPALVKAEAIARIFVEPTSQIFPVKITFTK